MVIMRIVELLVKAENIVCIYRNYGSRKKIIKLLILFRVIIELIIYSTSFTKSCELILIESQLPNMSKYFFILFLLQTLPVTLFLSLVVSEQQSRMKN